MNFESFYSKIIDDVDDTQNTLEHDCDQMHSYKDEAKSMALSQVENILRNATDIMGEINAGGEIHPWISSKLTIADDYITSVHRYLSHNVQENN